MKHLLLLLLFAWGPMAITAQTFSEFIEQLKASPESERQSMVDAFINKNEGKFPLIEGSSVYLLYNGPKDSMAVAGDFTEWDPVNAPMERVNGTRFWYKKFPFHSSSRVQYKLVSERKDWFKDPLNPRETDDGNDNSELRMPDYREAPEIAYRPEVLHGKYSKHKIKSSRMNGEREYGLYLPPGYETSDQIYPLVIVNDGFAYVNHGRMNNILDNLIEDKTISPVIALYVPPGDRTPEYAGDLKDAYSAMIIEELLPRLESNYRISAEPEGRAVIGSSYGGNISLWLAMHHSDKIRHVGAFSPYVEDNILTRFDGEDFLNLRIYMNHGTHDHLPAIHQSVEEFLSILDTRNYEYAYTSYPESHNYGFWRAHIDDALHYFFPYEGE